MTRLEEIVSLANMLCKTMGKMALVTVSDREKHLFAEGALEVGVEAGQPLSSNEKYFIEHEELESLPFVVNYKSLSPDMKKLRSSTFFYKDEKGKIEYMLSVTFKVDEFLYLRDMMNMFVNGSPSNSMMDTSRLDEVAKLDISAHELIEAVVTEGQKRYNVNVERMNKLEKQSLIREMHSRGVFLIKGAVNEAAKRLAYSETTVYRYLQKLDNNER